MRMPTLLRQAADRRRLKAALLLCVFSLSPLPVFGQGAAGTVQLKAGDTVQIVVSGRPDLDMVLDLDAGGRVDVPQVGLVPLAGLTPSEAGRVLRQRLRLLDPSVDSVLVSQHAVRAVTLRVVGAVGEPGAYSFEEVPSLWDLVRGAGGLLETAVPYRSRVMREVEGVAQAYPLDLSPLASGGRIPEFQFQTGDVLMIPGVDDGLGAVPSEAGIHVFGGVFAPTVVPAPAPTPLVDVLMLAGAPTEDAKLDEIWWVHRESGRLLSYRVQFDRFIEAGDPDGNPLIYPGDTVHVAYDQDNWLQRNIPFILGSLATAATVYLAYDRATD